MNDTTIHLISGLEFDYADPFACMRITPHDLGHALARVPRFAGHTRHSWSVAQHTLLCVFLVRNYYREPWHSVGALHHDDVEAFTGDWTSPMKKFMVAKGFDYRTELEAPIEAALSHHIGFAVDDLHAGVVKDADRLALCIEGWALKPAFNPDDYGCGDVDQELAQTCAPLYIADRDERVVERAWVACHEQVMTEWLAGDKYPDPDELFLPHEREPDADDE